MSSLSAPRAFAVALAVPQVAIGLWATITPRGWYDDFPGLGPALASAEPPFNQHLITDAGAGFLAVGVLLALAAWRGRAPELQLAGVVYLFFGLPHTIYHAAHPSALLSDFTNVLNVVLLGAQLVAAAVLIVLTTGRRSAAWAS